MLWDHLLVAKYSLESFFWWLTSLSVPLTAETSVTHWVMQLIFSWQIRPTQRGHVAKQSCKSRKLQVKDLTQGISWSSVAGLPQSVSKSNQTGQVDALVHRGNAVYLKLMKTKRLFSFHCFCLITWDDIDAIYKESHYFILRLFETSAGWHKFNIEYNTPG